jgi:hypothetical protein
VTWSYVKHRLLQRGHNAPSIRSPATLPQTKSSSENSSSSLNRLVVAAQRRAPLPHSSRAAHNAFLSACCADLGADGRRDAWREGHSSGRSHDAMMDMVPEQFAPQADSAHPHGSGQGPDDTAQGRVSDDQGSASRAGNSHCWWHQAWCERTLAIERLPSNSIGGKVINTFSYLTANH